MGGKGSGGHNRKTIEDHILGGTYREDRHGPLSKRLSKLLVSKTLSAKPHKTTRAGRPAEVVNGGALQGKDTADPRAAKTQATTGNIPGAAAQVQQVSLLPYPEIGFDEIAKKEWDRVCNMLIERGMINEVNRATLEGYCSAYSKAKRADQALVDGFEEEVPIVVGRGATQTTINIKKKKIENGIAEKAWGQVKMFAVLLGISSVAGDEPAPVKEEALSPMERAIREAETKR